MEMKSKLNKLKGWFPQEPFKLHSTEANRGKSTATTYIVGYGVGLCVYEIFIVLVNMAGWGAFESSLSEPFDIISDLLICFIGTMLALAIGAKLSRKLKERWIR